MHGLFWGVDWDGSPSLVFCSTTRDAGCLKMLAESLDWLSQAPKWRCHCEIAKIQAWIHPQITSFSLPTFNISFFSFFLPLHVYFTHPPSFPFILISFLTVLFVHISYSLLPFFLYKGYYFAPPIITINDKCISFDVNNRPKSKFCQVAYVPFGVMAAVVVSVNVVWVSRRCQKFKCMHVACAW